MKDHKVIIHNQEVNLSDVADEARAHALLVPDNWKSRKRDCVSLFIAIQDMLAFQLRRHLAHNFKDIVEVAGNQQKRGVDKGARVGITFGFELDFTAPTVAAVTDLKMGFTEKYQTKGKPLTKDLSQMDMFEMQDVGLVVDPGIAAEMQAEADAEAAKQKEKEAKSEAKTEAAEAKEELTLEQKKERRRAKDAERKRKARAAQKASTKQGGE